jgi:cytoskeletal protein RodZ
LSGDILRKKREELGLEIRQVSDQLRIRADYLSSIEQDLFDKLPAPVYTMGYIRSYARHLDVDPTAILEVYAQRLPKPKTDAAAIPIVLAEKRRPVFLYLFLAVAVAAIGAGIYLLLPYAPVQKHTEKAAIRTEVRPHKIENQPAPSREKAVGDIKAETKALPPPRENQKAAATPSLPAAPVVHPQERAASDEPMHLLSIQATETSWIYVKFKNGKYESVTLRPGSSRQWNFAESTYLKIGNAGGIKVTLDGRELGPVGQSGQVVTLTLPQQPQ